MSEATVSEEQVLHNELSFEINQELIHLMKRIVEIQRVNKQLKENNMSMQEEMARTWKKLDDLQQIEQEHQKINGELNQLIKNQKKIIEKLNKNNITK